MALTKKIDELDPYGSVDSEKRKKDLFEVSKNEGTYADPEYLIGGSRKITQEELENLLGYIPYSGPSYNLVKNNGSGTDNGIAFAVAVANASTKATDGYSDRCVVFVWPGYYDIQDTVTIPKWVDIIGVGDPKNIIFDSNYAQDAIFFIDDADNDSVISNITIVNNGNPDGYSILHDTGIDDNGEWNNLIISAKTTKNIDYAGNYTNVTATENYVLAGNITGKVANSTFLRYSCGYGEVDCTISGTIEDCTCDRYCFGFAEAFAGVCTITSTARIRRCKSTLRSFGFASQEANSIVDGLIEDCEDGDEGFGGTTASGKLIRCKTPMLFYPHAGTLVNCEFIGATPNIILKDGATFDRCKAIASGIYGAIETEVGAEVSIYLCISNVGINSFSSNPYTNLVPLPRNVIFDQNYEIFTSPDGNLWKLTIDNTGTPTTELIP